MTTALAAYTPTDFDTAMRMATTLADGRLLPDGIHNPAQAFTVMAAGAELGIGPMLALRSIVMVKGKITLSAELMLRLVLDNGIKHHWVHTDNDRAELRLTRDGSEPFVSRFSMDDAQRAGLLGKPGPWRQYPANMLRARCISNGVRAYCPDMLTGVYHHGELDDAPRDPEAMQDVTAPPEPKPEPETDEAKRQRLSEAPATWSDGERKAFCAFLNGIGVKYEDLKAYCLDAGKTKPSSGSEKYRQLLAQALENGGRVKFDTWLEARADRTAHSDEAAHDDAADAEFEEVVADDVAPKASAGLIELRRIVVELIEMIGDDVTVGDLAGSFGVEWKLEGVAGFDEITLGHFKAALDKLAVST